MTMQMQNRKILMIQKRQMHLTAKNQTEKPRTVTARHQMVQARPKRLHQMTSKRATQWLSHQMMTETQQLSQSSPWAVDRVVLAARLPVWTATMQQMNTAQMKQSPIPLWNLQEQTKMQHLFPMVQRLPSAMTQSQEHLPTARAVITPASMVQVQQFLPQTELHMSKAVQ